MKALPHIAFYTSLSLAVALGAAGCKNNPSSNNATPADQQDQAQTADQSQDPANANVAPVSNASDNTGAPNGAYQSDQDSSSGQYDQNDQRSRHPRRHTSGQDEYADNYPSDSYNDNSSYYQPVDYATQPPPPLPQYDQPPAPGDGYIWTPGYWSWDNSQGYYWAPGAWVLAPYQGALWTPGYWGYTGGRYGWHRGYWGRHVGYYGGINYGFGYVGFGYQGGYWNGNQFAYNRAVNNVNTTVVRNVYNYRVTNVTETRVSYNGGNGGVNVQPRPAEIAAMREQHNPPMSTQMQVVQQAKANPQNFARVSHDRPAMVAVSHPVQADRNVKAPPPVRYQAQNQRPNQPAQQQSPNPPMNAQQQRGEQNRPGANREAQPGNQGHLPDRAAAPQRPQQPQQPQRQQQTPAGSAQQQRGAEQGRVSPGRPEPQHTGPQHPVPQQKAEPNRQEAPRGQAQQATPQQHPAQQGKAQQERKQEQQKKNDAKKNEDKRPQQ